MKIGDYQKKIKEALTDKQRNVIDGYIAKRKILNIETYIFFVNNNYCFITNDRDKKLIDLYYIDSDKLTLLQEGYKELNYHTLDAIVENDNYKVRHKKELNFLDTIAYYNYLFKIVTIRAQYKDGDKLYKGIRIYNKDTEILRKTIPLKVEYSDKQFAKNYIAEKIDIDDLYLVKSDDYIIFYDKSKRKKIVCTVNRNNNECKIYYDTDLIGYGINKGTGSITIHSSDVDIVINNISSARQTFK